MTHIQILLGIGLAVLLNSCASIQTKTQYDPKGNFSQYRTYQWILAVDKDVKDPEANDQLFDRWVRTAVDSQLAAKGYKQETSGSPDFLINYHTSMRDDLGSGASAYPYFVEGQGWGWWASSKSSRSSFGGALILDVLDGGTRKIVWLGRAQAVVRSGESRDKKEKRVNEAVSKMLAHFPPEKH
jgi:Domain of unknown function (DUF4136)